MVVHTLAVHATPACRTRWSETLGDRSHVTIRPLEPADGAVRIGFADAAPRGLVSMNVLGHVADPPPSPPDGAHDRSGRMVFVAVARAQARESIVGIGELQCFGRGMHCRCDVLVDADWNDKGLGTSLMRRLIGIAGSLGMRCMLARCRAGDHAVTDLAQALGFRTRRDDADPTWLLHELNLPGRG